MEGAVFAQIGFMQALNRGVELCLIPTTKRRTGASTAEKRRMTKPGRNVDDIARTEVDHHMKCPGFGQWFDMHDLAQVVEHIHDSEIELEGPEQAKKPDGVNRRA
jgi:hypothetical protein